jgi:hypothetical protein
MTEENSIELFRLIYRAIDLAEDEGSIALLEAVKFREAQLSATHQGQRITPVAPTGELPCGCDSYVECKDKDTACPERDAVTSNNGDKE